MIHLAIIGAGNRARKYVSCLTGRSDAVLSAIVDPSPLRRRRLCAAASLPESVGYSSFDEMLRSAPEIDAVIISAPDRLHYSLAMDCLRQGWHVLVEKPLARSWSECVEIADEAERRGLTAGCCLVMRYHPYYQKIKDLIDAGSIGDICRIAHREAIGPDRMSHSFVRGNWSRSDEAVPIFVAKCSHDMDYLLSLTGGHGVELSSVASRRRFLARQAPEGAALRCCDCAIESDCPYSAVDLYARRKEWIDGFDVPPTSHLDDVIAEELRTGRYGRCVYHCDNNVADYQEVSILVRRPDDREIAISVTLDGISLDEGRSIRIEGTRGRLEAADGMILLQRSDPEGRPLDSERMDMQETMTLPLHAGADRKIVEDFLHAVATGCPMKASAVSTLEAHRLCFEA